MPEMEERIRPVLFLDVDGVLNAVAGLRAPEQLGFPDFKEARCNGFIITYSQQMADRLAALDVDIVWLTTWCMDDLCNKLIGPLFGWDILPTLWSDEPHGWWKSYAAQEYLAKHPRPFIWLDDDLHDATRRQEVEWLRDTELPFLCLSPDTYRGLRPAHFDKIDAFLEELAQA